MPRADGGDAGLDSGRIEKGLRDGLVSLLFWCVSQYLDWKTRWQPGLGNPSCDRLSRKPIINLDVKREQEAIHGFEHQFVKDIWPVDLRNPLAIFWRAARVPVSLLGQTSRGLKSAPINGFFFDQLDTFILEYGLAPGSKTALGFIKMS